MNPDPIDYKNKFFTPRLVTSFTLANAGSGLVTGGFLKKIYGKENMPADGRFILAANHSSLMDGPLLISWLNFVGKTIIHMISTDEPYSQPMWRWVLRSLRVIPVSRGDLASQERMMRWAKWFLQQNEPVAIFPEGGTNDGSRLRRPRNGVALMALESGAPILPVGIRGSHDIYPTSRKFPKLKRNVTLHIGKPICVAEEHAAYHSSNFEERGELIHSVLKKTMEAISELSDVPMPARI